MSANLVGEATVYDTDLLVKWFLIYGNKVKAIFVLYYQNGALKVERIGDP